VSSDIVKSGFLRGTLVVPRFILAELQHFADSSDGSKRERGRRGLEILAKMQKETTVRIELLEADPSGAGADGKLVTLARSMNVPIMTNDYGLNRVAELQGVTVLNVNDLAKAVRPVVLPTDELNVRVSQEGREPGQGVAYLGAAGSPKLFTTKATDIPPGWYQLDGVVMEIDPMTDPATVASVEVTYVQLIDANTKGTYKEDASAKTGKSLRGGDATNIGAMTEAKKSSDKGASEVISAGRLPGSKWADWKRTEPAVIGTITPDGINH